MESKYIKLDHDAALSGKKQLLQAQVELLHVLMSMNNYRELRKKDAETKNKLRASMNHMKTKINHIQEIFPEEEKLKIKKKIKEHEVKQKEIKPQKVIHSKKERRQLGFEKELEEIQKKLANLS